MAENFLTQLVCEPTRDGSCWTCFFANREDMVGDVIARGHLGYNNHKVMEFLVLRYIMDRRTGELRLLEESLAYLGGWLKDSLGQRS